MQRKKILAPSVFVLGEFFWNEEWESFTLEGRFSLPHEILGVGFCEGTGGYVHDARIGFAGVDFVDGVNSWEVLRLDALRSFVVRWMPLTIAVPSYIVSRSDG